MRKRCMCGIFAMEEKIKLLQPVSSPGFSPQIFMYVLNKKIFVLLIYQVMNGEADYFVLGSATSGTMRLPVQ